MAHSELGKPYGNPTANPPEKKSLTEIPIGTVFKSLTEKPIYDYQLNLINDIEKESRIVVVKSRRIGITYVCAFYAFVTALKGKKTLAVFPSLKQALKFMEYIALFWIRLKKSIPQFRNNFAIRETKTEIAFENGGEVIALANNPDTVRGFGADLIYLDEAAHFPNIQQIWDSILPSISRGGKVAVISTPRGTQGLFYQIWQKSDNYKKISIPWHCCPDIKIEEIKKDMQIDMFRQEYECEFLSDEDSYFPFALTTPCIEIPDSIIQKEQADENKNEQLIYGIDIGRKRDFTAIIGLKRKKAEDGSFHYHVVRSDLLKKTEYEKQLSHTKEIIKANTPKQTLIDAQGIGSMLAEILVKEFGSGRVTPIIFDKNNKNDMMVWLRKNFEDKTIIIPYANSDSLINSLRSIRRETTQSGIRYDADRDDETGHADEAFALALAMFAFKSKSDAKFLDLDINGVIG